jgi:hypothetical protein
MISMHDPVKTWCRGVSLFFLGSMQRLIGASTLDQIAI